MTEIYEGKNVNPGVSSSEREHKSPGSGGPREGVEEFTEEARRKGIGFFEEQKKTAAESLGRIAEVLHDTHTRLEREQPSAARLFGQGADVLERTAESLRRNDAEALMRQAQDFARRQPALMLGGALAAGFFMTRMFKSTSHRSEFDYGSQDYGLQKQEFIEKAKESAEKVKESLKESAQEKEGSSRIILSPNEPHQDDVSKKPSIQEDLKPTTLLGKEEERHATD